MVVRGTHRPHEDGSFMGWGRVLHIVHVERRVSIFTQRAGELVLVTTTPPLREGTGPWCEVFVILYNVRRISVSLFDTEKYIVASVILYITKRI